MVARQHQYRNAAVGDAPQLLRQIQMALLFPVQGQIPGKNQRRRLLPDDLLHKGVGQLVDVGQRLAVATRIFVGRF